MVLGSATRVAVKKGRLLRMCRWLFTVKMVTTVELSSFDLFGLDVGRSSRGDAWSCGGVQIGERYVAFRSGLEFNLNLFIIFFMYQCHCVGGFGGGERASEEMERALSLSLTVLSLSKSMRPRE